MNGAVTLAVVDDHPITNQGLVQLFADGTICTVVARGRSSSDAVAIADQHQPDVIILDLGVPGNALATIAQIVAAHPKLKIIAFTAAPGVEYAVNALEAGARGYVSKTCELDELLRAVTAVVGGDTFVSQSFAAGVITALRNASVRKVASQALKLSVREDQIIHLLLHGKTNKEIAIQLKISEKTVKHYMTVLMQKLNARNRVEAVIAAQKLSASATETRRLQGGIAGHIN